MGIVTDEDAFNEGNALFVEGDYEGALKQFTDAIELSSTESGARYHVHRGITYFQMGMFQKCVDDCNTAIERSNNNIKAFLRKGLALFEMGKFKDAREVFLIGKECDGSENIAVWDRNVRKCDAELEEAKPQEHKEEVTQPIVEKKPEAVKEVHASPKKPPVIKHEWYQTDTHVTLGVMIKNVKQEMADVDIDENSVNIGIHFDESKDVVFDLVLFGPVVPEECTTQFLSTKIEIKLKKKNIGRWPTIEGSGEGQSLKNPVLANSTSNSEAPSYPSSKGKKDWNKILKEEEEGDEEEKKDINAVFQDIFSNADEEQKRAMLKSFQESGGTVLSTNWQDVGKRYVEPQPPEGMVAKKY